MNAYLPPSLSSKPYASGICCLLSLVQIGLGVTCLVNPLGYLAMADIKPSNPQSTEISNFVVPLVGARNIALGGCTLAAAYLGLTTMLGVFTFAGAMITFTDGAVVYGRGKGGEWGHWFLTPVQLGLGWALLMK